MKDKKIIVLIVLILISIIALIGSSYALLTKSFKSEKLSMQVGTLKVDFTEGNAITMGNTMPMTDENGMNTTPYTFTITNSGDVDAYYTVSNEEELANTLDTNYLKMRLTGSDGYDSGIKRLKDLGTSTYRIVDERALQKSKSVTYKLYLWISSDADNSVQDKVYKSKIVVSSTSNRVGDTYCLDNGFTKLSDCMLVINNHEKTTDIAKTNIKDKGTPDFSKTATTDEGLFMAEDDEGESYYYRGAVKNNYVSFAGFIWRIIRRNGDGSIRMIYSGKSTSDTGAAVTIGNSQFNSKFWDPTYVGYKYNEDFSLHENNGTTGYDWFTNTTKYNFGTGYTFDTSTKKFTLTGDIKQLTWNDNHEEIVNNQLYSCLNMSCNVVYKIVGYNSATQMIVQPISYSSNSLLTTQTNKTDSPIKTKLDNWYKTNMTSYTSKLADETFCSDRSITSGSGYLTTPTTIYGSYNRLQDNKKPSLKCSGDNDKFKMSNASAKLNYPVALITADEVALAGGKAYYNGGYSPNSNYYLYNGKYYWTLSPSFFISDNSFASVWYVLPSGSLDSWKYVTDSIGVRPVINLRADTLITKGDGSALSPFVVK
ncbi:MAG: hypothetical protein LKJ84_02850 [Bacilli bacterium]|jgi:hypothetical protein|nr:hypothetical protein [Bacilli bacterium]